MKSQTHTHRYHLHDGIYNLLFVIYITHLLYLYLLMFNAHLYLLSVLLAKNIFYRWKPSTYGATKHNWWFIAQYSQMTFCKQTINILIVCWSLCVWTSDKDFSGGPDQLNQECVDQAQYSISDKSLKYMNVVLLWHIRCEVLPLTRQATENTHDMPHIPQLVVYLSCKNTCAHPFPHFISI